MASVMRQKDGRFENNQRAYAQAVEAQRDKLIILFRQAGIDPSPILWGHSGELSLNGLAALINSVSSTKIRVPEVHPSNYELEER